MKKVIILILIGLSVFSLTQCGKSEEETKQEIKAELKAEMKKEQEEKEIEEKGYSNKEFKNISKEQYQEWSNEFHETVDVLDNILGICYPKEEGYDYCTTEQAQQYIEQARVLQQQYSDSFPDFIKDKYNRYVDKTCEFANNIIDTGNVNQGMTEEQQKISKEAGDCYNDINNIIIDMGNYLEQQ